MKRYIALLLCMAMFLSACGQVQPQITEEVNTQKKAEEVNGDNSVKELSLKEIELQFSVLDDDQLLRYAEDVIYKETVSAINSEEYFVENVSAVYLSKEYIDELRFNSQSNVYFGYTMAELNEVFHSRKFIFTLGEDGTTTVQSIETLEDNSTETLIKNVAIGTGVILICVTVSAVTAGMSSSAVSMIFATSAKSAKNFAISSAIIGGISAGAVKGIETGDFSEAVEAAALGATEGFKWGAIGGTVDSMAQAVALFGAAKQTNFTLKQYAQMQQETGYPLDVIKQFHTMAEYEVFRDANLKTALIGGKTALVKTDIDLTRIDAKGRTNLARMKQGLAPLDSDGISFELHHIGQKKDGTLAMLTQKIHDCQAIHGFLERSEAHVAGTKWNSERGAFWKAFAEIVV